MVVPLVLFLCSAALAAFAAFSRGTRFSEGVGLSDLMLLALIMALASLILLVLALRDRWARPPSAPRPPAASRPRSTPRPLQKWLLVDGSNVMHWKDGPPQIETLREVVEALLAAGYAVGMVFDANAGYRLAGRYQDDSALARQLGLSTGQVFVVPKVTPADPYLLITARKMQARIITNDRYRDWAAEYPEVEKPGLLIWGGFRAEKLWLAGGVLEGGARA